MNYLRRGRDRLDHVSLSRRRRVPRRTSAPPAALSQPRARRWADTAHRSRRPDASRRRMVSPAAVCGVRVLRSRCSRSLIACGALLGLPARCSASRRSSSSNCVWRGGFGTCVLAGRTRCSARRRCILTALCVAHPGRLGLVMIGGEGALVLGGFAPRRSRSPIARRRAALLVMPVMALAGDGGRRASGSASSAGCATARGVNETISIAAAHLYRHRDHELLRRGRAARPGLAQQAIDHGRSATPTWSARCPASTCIGASRSASCSPSSLWVLMNRTTFGFAARITGGNVRAAQAQGLPVGQADGRLPARSPAPAPGSPAISRSPRSRASANASLAAGYGFTGILVAFLARHNPLAIVAGRDLARRHRRRRRAHPAPHGHARRDRAGAAGLDVRRPPGSARRFTAASRCFQPRAGSGARMMNRASLTVLIAMLGGAIRVSTPFLFVASASASPRSPAASISASRARWSRRHDRPTPSPIETGSPWLGVLAAGVAGSLLGAIHGCDLPASPGQRHRHRHRADAVRHRPRLLLRQALHPAHGAASAARSRSASGPSNPQVAERAAGQPAVLGRHRARRRCCGGRSATRAGRPASCA